MGSSEKARLIERLTCRFDNLTARAAAINEVLTAFDFRSCFDAIVVGSADPTEAVFAWAVKRGELWA